MINRRRSFNAIRASGIFEAPASLSGNTPARIRPNLGYRTGRMLTPEYEPTGIGSWRSGRGLDTIELLVRSAMRLTIGDIRDSGFARSATAVAGACFNEFGARPKADFTTAHLAVLDVLVRDCAVADLHDQMPAILVEIGVNSNLGTNG